MQITNFPEPIDTSFCAWCNKDCQYIAALNLEDYRFCSHHHRRLFDAERVRLIKEVQRFKLNILGSKVGPREVQKQAQHTPLRGCEPWTSDPEIQVQTTLFDVKKERVEPVSKVRLNCEAKI